MLHLLLIFSFIYLFIYLFIHLFQGQFILIDISVNMPEWATGLFFICSPWPGVIVGLKQKDSS